VSTDPRFSIVTPVYDPPADVFEDMIDSVRAQTFVDWELILVDDCSPSEHVVRIARDASAADPRIRLIERSENGHIVKASNDGIAVARGEFIALLDHDDLLVADALETMDAAIRANPAVDYLYSDEDKIGPDGEFYDHFMKPDWSPERLRGQMYTSHLSVLRTSLVREVGGFHDGFGGSQDHDLVLRVTERARQVVHVPEVLYHWRAVAGSTAADPDAKPYAWYAGRDAVQAHLDRSRIAGKVDLGPVPGTYTIERTGGPDGMVSVVIPTRGGAGIVWGERRVFVVEAVRSLLAHAGDVPLEIVVVYDTPTPPEVLAELRTLCANGPRLVLREYTKPFSYSEKCNVGVLAASGRWLLLLNDDIEIITPDFVRKLVAPLLEEGVGMTGARLLFSDGTIQHAGVVYRHGDPWHAYYGDLDSEYGIASALLINRECSGLTGACVAMARDLYLEVGGFTELLPANFNDLDMSLKVAATGRRLVWIAGARAYHFESKTRIPVVHAWEHQLIKDRWASGDRDRYLPAEGPG